MTLHLIQEFIMMKIVVKIKLEKYKTETIRFRLLQGDKHANSFMRFFIGKANFCRTTPRNSRKTRVKNVLLVAFEIW